MAANATIGLKIDLQGWSKSLTQAASLGNKVMEDVGNNAVARVAGGALAGLAEGAVAGLEFSITKAALGGLSKAAAFAGKSFVPDTSGLSKRLEDAIRTANLKGVALSVTGDDKSLASVMNKIKVAGLTAGKWFSDGFSKTAALNGPIGKIAGAVKRVAIPIGAIGGYTGKKFATEFNKGLAGVKAAGGILKQALKGMSAMGASVFGGIALMSKKAFAQNDAYKGLESSLNLMGDAQKKAFDMNAMDKYFGALTNNYGITKTEAAKSAGEFVQAGARDQAQVQQLMTLSANAAGKTGKSYEDASKLMQQAMNGDIDAAKQLGITVQDTGDNSKNAMAIMSAATTEFGKSSETSAYPWDRMMGIMDNLAAVVGGKLSGYFSEICQYVGDFVSGLLNTEEGKAKIEEICQTIKNLGEFFITVGQIATGVFDTIVGTVKTAINGIYSYFASAIQKILEIAAAVAEKTGFTDKAKDLRKSAEGFKEFSIASAGQAEDAWGETKNSASKIISKNGDSLSFVSKMADQGAKQRESEKADLEKTAQSSGWRGTRETDADQQKQFKKQQEERQKALTDMRTKSPGGGASAGQKITVNVVNTRPQRLAGY